MTVKELRDALAALPPECDGYAVTCHQEYFVRGVQIDDTLVIGPGGPQVDLTTYYPGREPS